MMEKKMDRRIQRTKMAIREAFITLMNEKGFNAITVSDIAEHANINRGTFYVHYQDKYDLLEKTQSELIDQVQKILLEQNNVNYADIYQFDPPLPIIVSFFTFMKNNASLMRALYNFEGGLPLQARIRHLIKTNLKIDYAF